MSKPILHMIGNAHLDPVWLWTWQEGFQEIKATFRSALDRMAEYEDFIFTCSSAAFYEWVEQNDPRMFEEIRRRVAEGRWQVVGGWWVQPDCNIPSGESFVRQGLYGQRYFQSRFGVTARVGYNVDSFGHHGMLPQILRGCGLDYYVLTRPESYEKGLPGRLFWWESDDGSRVLTFRIPFEYGTWGKDLEKYVRRIMGELKAPFDELMCFYGVGNHGGGPTKENIESIQRMAGEAGLPELVLSTPDRFFASVLARDLPFPVVHDDLQHHASGCYAAHSGVKRWNRQAEQALLAAEKLSAVATLVTGLPYPDLDRAWKNVLFNQFHDILAGTSVEAAYDDARNLYGESLAIAGRALNDATQSLAWNIDIPQELGMRPIVVFNPHAWPVRAAVELELSGAKEGDALVDDEGRQVALQFVKSEVIVSGWRRRIAFSADLPALGYRVYRLRQGVPQGGGENGAWSAASVTSIQASGEIGFTTETRSPRSDINNSSRQSDVLVQRGDGKMAGAELPIDAPAQTYPEHGNHNNPPCPPCLRGENKSVIATDHSLENEQMLLELDPETGYIARLYDKRHGVEVLLGQGARPEVMDDRSDTWGHGVYSFRAKVGAFTAASLRLVEHGPVKSVLRVESAYGSSRLTQDFTLTPEGDQIDVRVSVDWREQHKALKLIFPVNLNFLRATYEIPYGHIERPTNGMEEACQSWVDVSGVARGADVPYGLSVLNDGKYSFDVSWRELGLTVLRSPIYAHHDPTQPLPELRYSYIDQGLQHFSYSLVPHAAGWEQAGTVRRAAELNQRPITLIETYHAGALPRRDSYLSVDQPNVIVGVLKRAEDGDDLVLRCYEAHKIATSATISLPSWGRTIQVELGPCQIKTLRIPRDARRPVVETDMLERVLGAPVETPRRDNSTPAIPVPAIAGDSADQHVVQRNGNANGLGDQHG